jgi:hypothetical protein
MKNLFMPALCWALAISHLFAQKALPPSAANHVSYWTGSAKQLLDKAGFVPMGEAAQVPSHEVSSRVADLQLDSTILFSNYTGTPDSTPVSRTTHTYPLAGAEVLVEWYYENADWQPLNRNTVIKDDLGRLVETMSEQYDPAAQAFVLDSRLEIFPRGSFPDLVDSIFVYAWDPNLNDWQRLMSILNSFDGVGQLAESLTTIDVFGQPMQFKDVYVYDDNGDNILISSYLVEGGLEIPANQVLMEYENHLVTSVTAMVSDGFDFLPQSRNTYEYTAFGKESIVESYEWDATANDWANTQTVLYDYDDLQRVSLKETRLYELGGGESREQLVYSYVEDELLALEETYIWDGGGFYFLTDRKYYYYSGEGPSSVFNPLPVGALGMYPNPTTRFLQVDIEEEASVQVFDQLGRLVLHQQEQPGGITLDLSEQPSGIYSVRAVTEDKYYAGRLVKQ